MLVLAFAAMLAVTDVTSLPAITGPTLKAQISALTYAEKITLLKQIGEKKIALELSDAQINSIYQGAGPKALLQATKEFLAHYNTYETILVKHERVRGKINKVPDRMLVRYRAEPLSVFMRWLPGGRHEGLEVLYNAEDDPRNLKAHLGGWLNIINVSVDIDSSITRRETKHSIREVGFGPILGYLEADLKRLEDMGESTEPIRARSVEYKGRRYWENVFVTPGPPAFYSAKARMLFDLENGVPRLIETWDKDGQLLESIDYESVNWIEVNPLTFDIENPEYEF